jgi:hypothetical protein
MNMVYPSTGLSFSTFLGQSFKILSFRFAITFVFSPADFHNQATVRIVMAYFPVFDAEADNIPPDHILHNYFPCQLAEVDDIQQLPFVNGIAKHMTILRSFTIHFDNNHLTRTVKWRKNFKSGFKMQEISPGVPTVTDFFRSWKIFFFLSNPFVHNGTRLTMSAIYKLAYVDP